MNREDIIRMAREAGLYSGSPRTPSTGRIIEKRLEAFAALVAAAERNKLAQWMIDRGYATGHGDTTEDLLQELEWQIAENWTRGMVNGVEAEREQWREVEMYLIAASDGSMSANNSKNLAGELLAEIRARGQA